MIKNQGIILIVILIWLFVLTLLIVNVTEQVSLGGRISSVLKDHVIAFNAAETGLQLASMKILNQNTLLSSTKVKISYQIVVKEPENQMKVFQVMSTAEYRHIRVRLQCEYLLFNNQLKQRNWREIY